MKNIKNYGEFQNEEINLKKTIAGLALGTSLALGNTSKALPEPIGAENVQQTDDITGWDKVKWGMSVDEVKSKYPETTLDSTSKYTQLKIKKFTIGNYTYEVNFVFDASEKLYCIYLVLMLMDPENQPIPVSEITFDNIKSKLVEKYGLESFNEKPSKYGMGSKWMKNSGTIYLSLSLNRLVLSYRKKEESGY